MAMMSVCAVVGIAAALGFATVGLSGPYRRIVIATLAFAVVGFLASVAIAVLGAARDTYVRRPGK